MGNLNAWLIVLASILLGIDAAGFVDITSGYWMWALAIIVLIIGVVQLVNKK